MMNALIGVCLSGLVLVGSTRAVEAQVAPATVTVRVEHAGEPVESARVSAGSAAAQTDERGAAVLRVQPGTHTIRAQKPGLHGAPHRVVIARDTTIVIVMEVEALEHEAIIVSSTRTDRRIEDEPIRVEVVGREEIEEKLLMTPGDIAMLLNETAGLRVQPTAPSLGGASVRVYGLRGRYTQILSDGLPLFGGQTGALGPLQIPPMDLGQVEVIKGAASALYGASALGGVVNLISRRPPDEPEHELLLNQSTLGGTDAVAWSSRQWSEAWGHTLLAGAHRQSTADVDDDGWADLPSFRRVVLRPRLFHNHERGSLLVTVGGMLEDREGGTVGGRTTPAGTPHREALDTQRADAGVVGRILVGNATLLTVRGSAALQRHDHRFGERRERDRHATSFAEAALASSSGSHTWLIGAALQRDDYAADDVAGFDYSFTIPGLFVQDEIDVGDWLVVSGSARFDHHTEYGSFFNPRLSALLRAGEAWSIRASAGTGYFAPTPWIEEAEAVGLGALTGWRGLSAERARSASFDVGYTDGDIELNAAVFGSRIRNAVQARPAADATRLELFNAAAPVDTRGTELLARYHHDELHVTATYVLLHSMEPDPVSGERRRVPLTPRHAAGIVAAWEFEGRGRIGAEFYYTGRQRLDENPYRSTAPDHVIVGLLVERRFGPVRAFLNAENLLDTRQTRHDPLLLPARSPDGRWITDVWAPLEGRAFNAGLRWSF